MKSFQFNDKEIIITFDNEEKPQKLYNWIKNRLIQDDATVNGNVFTYDISNSKTKASTVKTLMRKIVYDSDDWDDELYSSAFSTDKYDFRLNCWVRGDKILRITPIKKDGTLGTLDFGVGQYTERFSLILTNKPNNELVLLSQKGHVGDFKHHELRFTDVTILIEVGEIKF